MKYYLHDTSSFEDEKIYQLFIEHGYEGLGLFYTILEKIAKQEKPINTKVLKRQLHIGKKLDKIWSLMEKIELISAKNGETFNEQLLNYSKKYQIKKEKSAKRISEWREKQAVSENVTRSENVRNAPKVNKSKVKVYIPQCEEVIQFFIDNGYKSEAGIKAYNYYNESGWIDSNGKRVLNWKQKIRGVWFKDENKIQSQTLNFAIPVN